MTLIASTAHAADNNQNVQANPIAGIFPIIIIFAIFYFLVIMPQQKKLKKHKELINNLKKGDVVLTNGGVYGKINKVTENNFELIIAQGTIIQIAKEAVANVLDIKFSPISSDEKKDNKTSKARKK
ncbi:MAG: preprotein translocase subunit YajC [Rickettsiales bacterium]|nr:preprotein translocase subunit YajC [Rickettsiales bacterium]